MTDRPSGPDLIQLLREDREAGAEALLETYTPLLTAVCARYLEDPEDIRECVSDTVCALCLAPEQYDPERMSLKNYLCLIARNRAIDRYRREQRRLRSEEQASRLQGLPGDFTREELEEAIDLLKPEDAKIVRMKYFQGLTYKEIAQSLGMDHETVKKRGRKSLRDLLKYLIVGLILTALLAGCAYAAYRYFYFAPGAGVRWELDEPLYQLAGPTPPLTVDDTLFQVAAAYCDGQSLQVTMNLRGPNIHYSFRLEEGVGKSESVSWRTITDEWKDRILRFRLEEPLQGDQAELTLVIAVTGDPTPLATLPFQLVRSGLVQDSNEIGQVVLPESLEREIPNIPLLVAKPYLEGPAAVVPVYPVKLPEGYRLSPQLVSGYAGLLDGDTPKITLTARDGTIYTPILRGASEDGDQEIPLYFMGVPPGDYTLDIPCICVIRETATQTLQISSLDLLQDFQSLDQWAALPDGSALHITGVLKDDRIGPLTTDQEGMLHISSVYMDGVYNFSVEQTPGVGLPLQSLWAEGTFYYDDPDIEPYTTSTILGGDHTVFTLTRSGLSGKKPKSMSLTFRDPMYMLEHSCSLKVTIPEP